MSQRRPIKQSIQGSSFNNNNYSLSNGNKNNVVNSTNIEPTTSSTSTTIKANTAINYNTIEGSDLQVNLSNINNKYNISLNSNALNSNNAVSIDKLTVKSSTDLTIPYGYINGYNSNNIILNDKQHSSKYDALTQQRMLYDAATQHSYSPFKQLFGTFFMLWMSGSTLQVFSIFMLFMSISQPIQKIISINTEFERFKQTNNGIQINLLLPKLIYLVGCLCGIAIVGWKCNQFGLLPTSVVDYIDTDVPYNSIYVQS